MKTKTAYTTWGRVDVYRALIPCPHRFRTALRVLLRGNVAVEWITPVKKNANKYVLEGEKL